jgi:serine/threonine protein kinase
MPLQAVVLEVVDGPAAGKVFRFRGQETFSLGRSDTSSLRLEDDLVVSRNHLQIEIDPPRCYVRDLESANGTFVNGERIAERLLKNGDTISGGKTLIRVVIEEPEEDPLDCLDTSGGFVSLAKTDLMELPPASIKGYMLAEQIGNGTMGVVHRAVHSKTRRVVAVKLIAPSMVADEMVVKSMIREASVLRQLDHKRIVRFIDTGVEGSHAYLIMEYVAAIDLMAMLRNMKTAARIRVSCGLVRQVLDGLAHAHDEGMIHRDIKPGNILVSQKDNGLKAKLADFGLAKNFVDAGLSRFSGENEVKGTLRYMAPEQIESSRNATPKSDLYSAAATLYTLISDAQMYDCSDGRVPIDAILRNGPIPIQQHIPDAPSKLVQFLDRGLQHDPTARFQSAREMREALKPLSGIKADSGS